MRDAFPSGHEGATVTRFLISGLGSAGRRHLRNLKAIGQEDVVLHRTGRSTLPDEDLDGLEVESDIEDALDRWQPEAVLVTNPTAHHLDVAIPAARAGCSLFIEKPISHTMDGIKELTQALVAGGGRALVGYHFRFNPGLRTAKRLLEEGAIGRVLSARNYWGEYLPDWHPWEDYRSSYAARAELGGGVVLTLSHPFDYLRWLLGDVADVEALTANSGTLGIEVEDSAGILATMGMGVLTSVQLDYLRRPPAHWLDITGSEGAIRWDAADSIVRWWNGEWNSEPPPEGFERNSMFIDEIRHFVKVVNREEEPLCSLEDGVHALEFALMVQRSARSGARIAPHAAEVSG